MRNLTYLSRLAFIAGLMFVTNPEARAQAKPDEYQVKAAFLFNFSKFIEWPPRAPGLREDSFDICVIGKDPFGKVLDQVLAGETIGGKPAGARRIQKPGEAAACRILYISSSEDLNLKSILDAIDKAPVLTVSDLPRFAQKGGMIQFVLSDNRVRFEVDLSPAERAHLVLSSELLKIAAAVRRTQAGGR